MKIVLCSHDGFNYMGGPYQWAIRIGQVWQQLGWEVVYLFLSDFPAEKSTTYLQVRANGFEAHVLPLHSLSNYKANTESRVEWFYNKGVSLKPDVFVANNLLPALYAARFLKARGVTTIGVLHTPDPVVEWMIDVFTKQTEWQPTAMVGVAGFLANRMKQEGEGLQTAAIPCGTPIPTQQAKFDQPFKVVYLGKLATYAKQIMLLTAALVKATRQNANIEAYIVGDGPQKQEVLNLLEAESGHQVKYLGKWEPNEVVEKLTQFQCLVLLSDFEGMPTVITEAMAAGCVPVCLRYTQGIQELVTDNENGLLADDRDEDFIRQLNKLSNDSELWNRLSENGKKIVVEGYGLDAVGQQWQKLITQCLSKPAAVNQADSVLDLAKLPAVHPLLTIEDIRKPSLPVFVMESGKRIIQKFRSIQQR